MRRAVFLLVLMFPVLGFAQKPTPAPRTADGHPDLSGYWKGTRDTIPTGNIGKDLPGLKLPLLRAVVKDGVPVVIWSHFSLGNGWEELPNPYAKAYDDTDALKLGTNVLVYALTH